MLPLVNGLKKPDNRPKDDRPPKTAPSASVPPKVGKKSQKAPTSSNKPSKPAANQRSTAEGASRRRLFQQGTRAPAFVEYPVVLHDIGEGAARFDKLGPWHSSQLLANVVGAIRSVRPLPSGKWLIGCGSEAQQSKLARLETLTGGVPIGARVPRPVVDGVVGPIPKGGNELQLVRQDLEAGDVPSKPHAIIRSKCLPHRRTDDVFVFVVCLFLLRNKYIHLRFIIRFTGQAADFANAVC